MSVSSTKEIIADIRAGRMVVLVDEEDRENEGDLLMAADCVTPEAINFMVTNARGLVCLTLTEERCKQLGLAPMARENKSQFNTAFTASIEAAEGVTTGISAHDRARTVQVAVARDAKPADIVQPGHIFPIMARDGGVLVRAGHTEAGCDLAKLAGREPAAVICEILKADGTMARLPDLIEFARTHNLKIGAIADLIHYRSETETLVERVAEKTIHCHHGEFRLAAFKDKTSGELHLALSLGEIRSEEETLVRVHQPVSVLDFLDCKSPHHTFGIDQAMQTVAAAGKGVIVLLRRYAVAEDILEAFKSQPARQPVKWDPRLYGIGAQILRSHGVGKMRLMASPRKMPSMTGFGLEICGYLTLDGKKI